MEDAGEPDGDNEMNQRRTRRAPRLFAALTAGTFLAAGSAVLTAQPAQAATTAAFLANGNLLSVFGDSLDNVIDISRNAAGQILVNNGAVAVSGGSPTVANVELIQVFGQGGNDVIRLTETNGALPAANLFGGAGNDVVTGGSGNDRIFGQAGIDTLLGRGGTDLLFGGSENDTVTGGDGDDQSFGEAGNDRLVWNPGDDTDLNEGGPDVDTVEVNGGNGTERFEASTNGSRARLARVDPAPFSLDIGSTEKLVVNANGGDDKVDATNLAAASVELTVDGGLGNDSINGGSGNDVLLGGDGDDVVNGRRGNDFALLGAGNDSFAWNVGDGNDVVEGQGDADQLAFRGSGANERVEITANGGRVRLVRDVANVVMDLNDLETVRLNTFGGADNIAVGDLSGTDVTNVVTDLSAAGGRAPDGSSDVVQVSGTNGRDEVAVSGSAVVREVTGLATTVSVLRADAGLTDRVVVTAAAGDDSVSMSGPPGPAGVAVQGGAGADLLIGGAGADVFQGQEGDDVLIGGAGDDVLDGGPGDDVLVGGLGDDVLLNGEVVINSAAASRRWLAAHARTADGDTVLELDRRKLVAPGVELDSLR